MRHLFFLDASFDLGVAMIFARMLVMCVQLRCLAIGKVSGEERILIVGSGSGTVVCFWACDLHFNALEVGAFQASGKLAG